ncbi:retrovirus-related pol polyprotein from transposon TNT 1-94 [Tanacetum coccineum]
MVDIMADLNIPSDDVLAEQAPAIVPPIRTDDQMLPSCNWVPIGKSNCVLNVLKPQKSPISQVVVAILKNTNFFRAFTESSTIPAIYIQQDALQITPSNDNDPFVAPPSSDTVIEYVNTLGYPSTLKNVSAMSVNSLYQPWRAILSMINMCLTGKTIGYDRPRHPVLQILWGIIHRSNIDYAERIWEEFVQSIQTFLTDKKNLTTAARGKKKSTPLLIPSIRFTKLIIHYLKTKHNIHPRTNSPLHYSHDEIVLGTLRSVGKDGREIFGMPIPDALLTDEIKRAPYYGEYLEHVAKYQQYLDEERGKAGEEGVTESPKATKVTKPKAAKQTKPSAPKAAKVTKPADDKAPKQTSSQPPKSTPAPTEPSKKDQGKKRKPVKETSDAPSPAKRSKAGKVTKKRMPKGPLQLVDEFVDEGVPEKEPVYGDEEANLQRALELSLKDQGERTQGPARPVVFREPDSGRFQPLPEVQGKGKEKVIEEQAAHDLLTLQTPKRKSPAEQFIFQRRTPMPTEPSGIADSPSLDVDLAPTDSEIESHEEVPGINAGDQDEGQAGPNPCVQDKGQLDQTLVYKMKARLDQTLENLKLPIEDQVIPEDPTSSTGTLSSLQNLDKELSFTNQFLEEKPQEEEPDKTNTESESPQQFMHRFQHQHQPPQQSQQQHLSHHHHFNDNKVPQIRSYYNALKVSKAVDEIVTDAVDWAMQAPLRARFSDLLAVDMKEALQQRMFEDKSYLAHEDHKNLFEALEKSLERTSGALGSSQFPSPPPPLSTGTSGSPQQQGNTGNDHLLNADMRKGWWKPLLEEERPATPEPAWTIPSSNISDVENNWASALVSTYESPAENLLLAKIGDMTTFVNWYCSKVNKTMLTQADFEGQEYEVVKAFYPDVIHLQFQMEECHKMLTDQINWANPEGDQVKIYVSRPLPLGGPPVPLMVYLTGGSIDRSSILRDMILRLVEEKSEITCEFSVYKIAEKDFKNLNPSELLRPESSSFTRSSDHLSGSDKRWDAKGYKFKHDYTIIESPRAVVFPVNHNERKIMRFNEIYKFSDGTLTRILEALDYRVKEFKIKWLNSGMNTRFWTQKDVTRSKEFMSAIERRLKTRRIYRNLECFVGGRVRDIDYRLLQRTE